MSLILSLLAPYWGHIIAGLGAAVAALALYAKVRKGGVDAQRAADDRARAKAIAQTQAARKSVDEMTDEQVKKELEKWSKQ